MPRTTCTFLPIHSLHLQTIPWASDVVFSNNQEILSSHFSNCLLTLTQSRLSLEYNTSLQPTAMVTAFVCFIFVGFFPSHDSDLRARRGNGFPWSQCNLQKLLFYRNIETQMKPTSVMLRHSPTAVLFPNPWSFSPNLPQSLAPSLQPPSTKSCHHNKFQIQENYFPNSMSSGHLQ